MAHVFEGNPDDRQSDEFIKVSRFRPKYRALSEAEKGLHDAIKDRASVLEALIETLPDSREKSLAMTKLEESIMWAIKGLTA